MKTFSLILFLLASALMLALATPVTSLAQTTRYVSTTGTNANPATATSWANSTTNLQGAIDAPGVTQVWVAAGVYKPTTTTGPASRTLSFSMKNGVVIYGGFVGSETALNQRPSINPLTGQPSSTTLSGEIGDPNSTTDNSYHIISNPQGLTTTAILDGFVLLGAQADGGGLSQFVGGAIYNDGSGSGQFCSPTIRNCAFQRNSAVGGGAIYNHGTLSGLSSPVVSNCTFQSNSASFGGAICNDGSSVGSSSPVVINCAFQLNSASTSGGAIWNNGFSGLSSPVLTNCSFQANSAGFGGAVFNNGAFSGSNRSEFTNCSFQANSASNGGAIYNSGPEGSSSPVLTNCAFQTNSAGFGGAITNNGVNAGSSHPELTNCSFQSNSATSGGGAIYNIGIFSGNSSPVLTNCVLFNNGGSQTIGNDEATLTASYSLFEPSSVTVTGMDVSGPGNLTTTTSPFATTGSVALAPCSPAINTGTNSATGLYATDLAGNPRIVDGRVDMGALEYQIPSSSAVLSLQADESVCPMRLLGRARGTSFVFTGPGQAGASGYVFSNVYRQPATYDVFALEVKQPGVYTLTAVNTNECGSSIPVNQTVTFSRSCP